MRKTLLAGNWKMNKLNSDLESFFSEFAKKTMIEEKASILNKIDIMFAVPFTLLARAKEIASKYRIRIAAQNIHFEKSGAYTGEISIDMLKDIGIDATLIGHSERRQYFGETDASVAKKVVAALANNIMPIVCIGELLEERKSGKTNEVLKKQMQAVLEVVNEPKDMVIAYEPVWAIGTGLTATDLQAQEAHALVRELLSAKFGRNTAEKIRVLYGGSAKPDNIAGLLSQKDIDGGLVGGASLKATDFAAMVNNASTVEKF